MLAGNGSMIRAPQGWLAFFHAHATLACTHFAHAARTHALSGQFSYNTLVLSLSLFLSLSLSLSLTHTHTHTHTHIHTHTNTHRNALTHMHLHTHARTHTYTHAHAHANAHRSKGRTCSPAKCLSNDRVALHGLPPKRHWRRGGAAAGVHSTSWCVCACACVCVYVCVRACVCASMCARVCTCVCVYFRLLKCVVCVQQQGPAPPVSVFFRTPVRV